MNEKFIQFSRGIFFYASMVLTKKNITSDLLIGNVSDLFSLIKPDIEEFDYSVLRSASSRVITFPYLEVEKLKEEELMSFFGLAYKDIKSLYKEIQELLASSLEERREFILNFNSFTSDFTAKLLNSSFYSAPKASYTIYVKDFLSEKDINSELFKTLTRKRIQIRNSSTNKASEDLKTIIDFYSCLTTCPFAFKVIPDYNSISNSVISHIIKEIEFCNLYEVVASFKVINWILTGKF